MTPHRKERYLAHVPTCTCATYLYETCGDVAVFSVCVHAHANICTHGGHQHRTELNSVQSLQEGSQSQVIKEL